MRIAMGCIVRNREWALPSYLSALQELDWPAQLKHYLFLENDSDDGTGAILDDFTPDPGAVKTVEHIVTGVKHWRRGEYATGQYAHLARIRNAFLEMFLATDADYLFSVDSDVIVAPGVLGRLLSVIEGDRVAGFKTIAGAAICNIVNKQLEGSIPGNFMVRKDNKIIHPPSYALSGVMDVDVIGAVYLIPRKIFGGDVRYAAHPQGEDIAFCQAAATAGYKLKVLLDSGCEHRMTEKR